MEAIEALVWRDPVRPRTSAGCPRLANKPREPPLVVRSREGQHVGVEREFRTKRGKID